MTTVQRPHRDAAAGLGGPSTAATAGVPDIHDVIDRQLVRTVFQPLVDLQSGAAVAMEALSRGPAGTDLETPIAMLAAADAAGRLTELDRVFRSTALQTAREGAWPRDLAVFVNAEPSTLSDDVLLDLQEAMDAELSVTVELTERDMVRDPSALLRAAERIRLAGGRVALDDVGAVPASVTLMPLLRPDVVKLDIAAVRTWGSEAVAQVSNAVRAYAEESGAAVVAEGIETADDCQIALVLGATVGQGWHFGRPAPLSERSGPVTSLPSRLTVAPAPRDQTPYDVIASVRPTAVSTKRLLLPISRSLEQRGAGLQVEPLLLSAFQQGRHFTPATARRYDAMAERMPLVCAFGTGLQPDPSSKVRFTDLDVADPFSQEWTVIVLGAHFAAALVARDLGDDGADSDRRFTYAVTHDRALVTEAARSLVDRIAARPV